MTLVIIGGTIEIDSFSLTIPPGAFRKDQMLEISNEYFAYKIYNEPVDVKPLNKKTGTTFFETGMVQNRYPTFIPALSI